MARASSCRTCKPSRARTSRSKARAASAGAIARPPRASRCRGTSTSSTTSAAPPRSGRGSSSNASRISRRSPISTRTSAIRRRTGSSTPTPASRRNTPASARPSRCATPRSRNPPRSSWRRSAGDRSAWSNSARERSGRLRVEYNIQPDVEVAVRAWQTESDWAKGPELGGWSEALLQELKDADLRGLGGAGIPATQKWKDVRDAVRTARLRGSGRPRLHRGQWRRERARHVQGSRDPAACAAYRARGGDPRRAASPRRRKASSTSGTSTASRSRLAARRSARAEALGFCGENAAVLGRTFQVSVFVSPGGYICGEQSALIEAMSDRRGEPRNMPPKLETNGLDRSPDAGQQRRDLRLGRRTSASMAARPTPRSGENTWKGRRFFSVSGDVKRPGRLRGADGHDPARADLRRGSIARASRAIAR